MRRLSFPLFLFVLHLHSNPTGESVIHGDATVTRSDILEIQQHSEKVILEWSDFSIESGEITRFIQPNADSVALNRVVGSEISKIHGRLEANGQIVLLNPYGVLIGKTGVVNAASFSCSGSEISNEHFLSDSFTLPEISHEAFINVEGRVEATGVKKVGGRIFLVADEVEISGELEALSGNVDVRGNNLSLHKSSQINVSGIEQEDAGTVIVLGQNSVDFSGHIQAEGGSIAGDGGFVEVSTRKNMSIEGSVSTMAPNGLAGMFLIDPANVVIMPSSGSKNDFIGTTFVIDEGNLTELLNSSPVTISTSDLTEQGDQGHFDFGQGTLLRGWTSSNPLTIVCDGNFTLPRGSTIEPSGPGHLSCLVAGSVSINDHIRMMGGDVSILAGPHSGLATADPKGSISFVNARIDTTTGGASGGSIDLRGYMISTLGENQKPHTTNSGSIFLFAEKDVLAAGSSEFLKTNTGQITVHANENILCSSGGGIIAEGPYVGTQLDIRADHNMSGVGDVYFEALNGTTSGFITRGGGGIFVGGHNVTFQGVKQRSLLISSSLISTQNIAADIQVQARDTITIQGGDGFGSSDVMVDASGDVLLQAGNDVKILGGTEGRNPAIVTSGSIRVGSSTVYAGRDFYLVGGTGTVDLRTTTIRGDQVILGAANDIVVKAGEFGAESVKVESTTFTPIIKAGRNVVFANSYDSVAQIEDNGLGCFVYAGGDICYGSSFSNPVLGTRPIYFEADATTTIFKPQEGPYLKGTAVGLGFGVVRSGNGAYKVDTGLLNRGIEFVTSDGEITIYSAAFDSNGNPADILFDEVTTPGAQKLYSSNGKIQVAGFRNTNVNNTISTGSSILIATDHTMNLNTPSGAIIAGGPVTLIVDEQNPGSNGGGSFNNFSNGVVTTDPQQRIAIYAASGPICPAGFSFPEQVFLGNLEDIITWDVNEPLGLLSKYNTSFQNGGQVHGAGFGTNYQAGLGVFRSPVIWYKDGVYLPPLTQESLIATQALRTLIPERLWVQKFSILVDQSGFKNHLARMLKSPVRKRAMHSIDVIGGSRDYLLRSTMSGEFIRIEDSYQEFIQSPFWNTPYLIDRLHWLEGE